MHDWRDYFAKLRNRIVERVTPLPSRRILLSYAGVAALVAVTGVGYWQYPRVVKVVGRIARPAPSAAAASAPELASMADLKAVQEELHEVEQAVSDQRTQLQATQQKANELQDNLKAAVDEVIKTNDLLQSQKTTQTATSSSGSVEQSNLVNLNTATLAQLETLPGIGATYAQKIIDYRTKNGPFKKIEDVEKVTGIGPATFAKFKDQVEV